MCAYVSSLFLGSRPVALVLVPPSFLNKITHLQSLPHTSLIQIVNDPDLVTLFASAAFVRVVLRFTRHPAPVIPTLGTTKHTLTRGNELVHVEYTLVSHARSHHSACTHSAPIAHRVGMRGTAEECTAG